MEAQAIVEIGRALRTARRHLALVVTVSLMTAGCSATTGAAPSPSPSAQACAWPVQATVATDNAAAPDAAASYWLQPFTIQGGLRITVSGRYPDARYASLQVYTGTAAPFAVNGVESSLADYQIAPDAGSANPWQSSARPGGRFTVTLRSDVSANEVNTLPLSPDGTAPGSGGYLQYRVYLPAGGDFSKVVPPTITLHEGGGAVAMAPCRSHGSSPAPSQEPSASAGTAAQPTPGTNAVPAPLKFFKIASDQTFFRNVDSTYILTYVMPPAAGDVVVIAGRAPRASTGDHPSRWPAPDRDMRYWSMCTYLGGTLPLVVNRLGGGAVDTGCRSDEATRLDSSGNYLYVIGTEAQRGAIEGITGATFLPFSSAQPTARHLVLLRNMLVMPGFAYSSQAVTRSNDPAATAAVMGPYYPRAAVCSLTTLAARGPAGCASGS
jgi:hypothetical protein